jgi:hypothetical protein
VREVERVARHDDVDLVDPSAGAWFVTDGEAVCRTGADQARYDGHHIPSNVLLAIQVIQMAG